MIGLRATVSNTISNKQSIIFGQNNASVPTTPSTKQSTDGYHSSDSSLDSLGTPYSMISGNEHDHDIVWEERTSILPDVLQSTEIVPEEICTSSRFRETSEVSSVLRLDDYCSNSIVDSLTKQQPNASNQIDKDLSSEDELLPQHVTSNKSVLQNDNTPSSVDCIKLNIIYGKHKGKSGTLIKFTEKRALVVVDGTCSPIYMFPEHIQFLENNENQQVQSVITQEKQINPMTMHKELAFVAAVSDPEPVNSSPNRTFQDDVSQEVLTEGCKVTFVGGKYGGQSGKFVCFTEKRTKVIVDGTSKPVCLHNENVKKYIVHLANSKDSNSSSVTTKDWKLEKTPLLSITNLAEASSYSYFSSILGTNTGNDYTRIGLRVEFCRLLTESQVTQREQSIAYYWFRNRLATYKVELPNASCRLPHRYVEKDGCVYELLATKILDKNTSSVKGKPYECKSEYFLVSDPSDTSDFKLQQILEDIADFGVLTPQKAAARLQLLLSTSSKHNGENCIFDGLSSQDFEIIEENSNEGCGFIPRKYIDQFFGHLPLESRIFAIQVRIFAPKLGIFKGMLFEKPGIDKIQLPTSMLKVPASRNVPVADWAVVLITSTGIVPSKTNRAIENEWFKDIQPKFGKMMWYVMNDSGVKQSVIDAYINRWLYQSEKKHLCHTSVMGLADPTNAIPYNYVFITGISKVKNIGNEIFVSRYPCTNKSDGRLIRVVKEKPPFMSVDDYKWLLGLPFGGIIFGSALPGQRPMPSMIADGDLDGDNYFICWESSIISRIASVHDFVLVEDTNHTILKSVSSSRQEYNNNWFRHAQEILCDVQTLGQQQMLIGKLYGIWQELIKNKTADRKSIFAAGIAYKQSLDIQKHGGKVNLPSKLWNQVPSKCRHMLIDFDAS
jgi:ribosomal protein L24